MITAIAKALGNKSHRKHGGGWMCCCPVHDDNTPSLSIDMTNEGRLLVKCFAGCDTKLILKAINEIMGTESPVKYDAPKKPTNNVAPIKEWSKEAGDIWALSIPLNNSLAKTYLLSRGCHIPDSDDLGFIPNYKGHPAMVARVTCPLTNKPFTLHFTFLKSDGSGKADIAHNGRTVLYGHRLKGGVIRLSRDEDVTIGLAIAEGIETALCCNFFPIWATVNADNMRSFPVLEGIEELTIYADHDEAGLKAAQECVVNWRNAGKKARGVLPPNLTEDWADYKAKGQPNG